MRIFWRPQLRWIGPWAVALWTQALGDGFRPPALVAAICAGAVIYGRRIISLDNRSHYHLELESLSLVDGRNRRRSLFLSWSGGGELLSCGPSFVARQVAPLSH